MGEARELGVEGLQGAEVGEHRSFERPGGLARHEDRDARRVGHDHDGGHSTGHLRERHLLGAGTHQVAVGLARGRRRHGQLGKGPVQQLDRSTGANLGVHLVAELTQGHLAVAVRVGGDQLPDGLPKRESRVVSVLEAEQAFEQRAPLASRRAYGEEHEQAVVARLFDLDAMAVEVAGDDRGGDPRLCEIARRVDAGGRERDLDRIEHAVALLEPAEAVP